MLTYQPTAAQTAKIEELKNSGYDSGYIWDGISSLFPAGIVMSNKTRDTWFFGFEGEIIHNPQNTKS